MQETTQMAPCSSSKRRSSRFERGEIQAVNFNNVGQPRCVLQPRNSIVIPANGRPRFACVFATRFNSDAAASSTSFAIQRLVPLLLAVTRELIFGPPYKNASRINRGRNYYVSLRATTKRVVMASSVFTWRDDDGEKSGRA